MLWHVACLVYACYSGKQELELQVENGRMCDYMVVSFPQPGVLRYHTALGFRVQTVQ
jgi:hypothetical protein